MEGEKMTKKDDFIKIKKHAESHDRDSFNSMLEDFVPVFRSMIRKKLKKMEINNEIPVNMYKADEIIDEVYLDIFNNFSSRVEDESHLKIEMFKDAYRILSNLKTKHLNNTLSVDAIMDQELKELEEPYSINIDGEFMELDELDDISYHQDDYKDKILLLEDEKIPELTQSLEVPVPDTMTNEEELQIKKAYTDLPDFTQSVVDYFAFAKLTLNEIAEIHSINVDEVSEIIDKVKKRFDTLIEGFNHP